MSLSRVSGLLCSVVLGVGGALAAAAAEPENLAPNPGFEQADLKATGYGVQAKAVVVAEAPYRGQSCLRHEAVAGHAWNCVQMLGGIPVVPGKLYRLQVHCRNNLTAGQAFFGLREVPKTGGEHTLRYTWAAVAAGQTAWTPYALILRPLAEAATLQIYFRLSSDAVGTVWWDEASLTTTTDPFAGVRPGLVQVLPLENLVLTAANGHTTPESLPITMDAAPDAEGGTFTARVVAEAANGDVAPAPCWQTQQRIGSPGLFESVVPTAGLAEGRYRLELEVATVDGRGAMSLSKPLAVIPPPAFPPLPPVRESRVTPDGFLRVNGEPFLSVYYFHNPLTADGMKMLREEYGATTAQVWGGDSIDALCKNVDLVWQAGVYSWAVLFHPAMFDMEQKRWKDAELTQTIERLKAHPGLIGWDLIDEPDGLNVPPEEVRRAFDIVRRLDPSHAIWVNYCLKDKFAAYAGLSDFASYDHYPLQGNPLGLLREYDRAIREAFPNRPLLSCLQTWVAPRLGMPTPAQLRAQVYMSICQGMTLFHYYSWYDPPPSSCLMSNPELRSYTRLLAAELHALTPFLFATAVVPVTVEGVAPERSACLAKRVGDAIEVVVVNLEREPVVRLQLGVSGGRVCAATPMLEPPREVRIEDGQVVDHLPPYGICMYRLQVSGDARTAKPTKRGWWPW
ncbi:MAG: hypothetical protein A3K19_29490 [Lentisphaerae bacterium RIFOXYB12_FULL_65_16]|nr:MAG: hypothetical protein A3K18_33215 [Lentisphaerae bacterium RIFOXYA12_64_32]OGV88290.1 MAG: hypothetical protein A3K19_29490 [Lentisphaerae bacterium RIFOXYB12_FULL_65_16]